MQHRIGRSGKSMLATARSQSGMMVYRTEVELVSGMT